MSNLNRTLVATMLLVGLSLVVIGQSARDRNRDRWQRPDEVMDELGLESGSAVADIGAGRGYFTYKFAERVGPAGRVYAVDIQQERLDQIRRGLSQRGFRNVELIHGEPDDPGLAPDSVEAILIVNAYHEMRDFDEMLQAMHRALKPGGVLGIIDAEATEGRQRSRYHRDHEIPESLIKEDAARNGFDFLRKGKGFVSSGDDWYFLIFEALSP